MSETQFIIFVIIWPLFAIGYGGGLIYGVRFLRINNLIDTRAPEFVRDITFGRLGKNYRLFYCVHSQRYGKLKTKILLVLHFVSIVMVFATPIIFA